MVHSSPNPASTTPYRWSFLISILFLGGVLIWRTQFMAGQARPFDPEARPRAVSEGGGFLPEETRNIETFRRVSPSVVYITSLLSKDAGIFSRNPILIKRGKGSGFVWDKQGHIVTNYHVLQEGQANRWKITLANKKSYFAQKVGQSREKDLAVLWIDAPPGELHPIPIGSSKDLKVGQKVFAIGNPFGFDHTLTTGIISALNREMMSVEETPILRVIQIDAAINPGNSGGPLLDSSGRLIGVNTAIYSPSGSSTGIGFAVPVDHVNDIVPQLIRTGDYARPGLGISFNMEFTGKVEGKPGVFFLGFSGAGSPARKAGLVPTELDGRRIRRLGDLVMAINDYPIRTYQDFTRALSAFRVGEEVQVHVHRKGEELVVPITLVPITGK